MWVYERRRFVYWFTIFGKKWFTDGLISIFAPPFIIDLWAFGNNILKNTTILIL